MSALVVDTSGWVSWLAGGGDPRLEAALEDGRVHLPVVVAAELASGRLPPRQRRELEGLLGELPACGTDLAHWIRVGRLRARLAASGLSVSTPDAHVAQCALDLGGELLSEDAVFPRVARLVSLRLA